MKYLHATDEIWELNSRGCAFSVPNPRGPLKSLLILNSVQVFSFDEEDDHVQQVLQQLFPKYQVLLFIITSGYKFKVQSTLRGYLCDLISPLFGKVVRGEQHRHTDTTKVPKLVL